MVSVAVSKMGMTELIFVDFGVKVNGQLPWCLAVSADASSNQTTGDTFVYKRAPWHIAPATPSNCFSGRHRTSSVLTSGRQTAQIWTPSTTRSGESCSSVYINFVYVMLISWSSASLNCEMICSRLSLTRPVETATDDMCSDDFEHSHRLMTDYAKNYCN